MTCLADFHFFTVDQQMAVLGQMLQDKRDDEQARAQRHVERSLSPPVTAAEIIFPCTDAVVAGPSIYGAIA